MGKTDKMVRLGVAVLILVLYFARGGGEMSTTGIVLLIVAIILAATSFLNFCPLYSIFKFNTNKKD